MYATYSHMIQEKRTMHVKTHTHMYRLMYVCIHTHICMRSIHKVSSHVVWKIEPFIEEDTRNTVHRTMTAQSPSNRAPRVLTQFSRSPSTAQLNFSESHQQSEICSLSKVILVLGKARSLRVPNPDYRGTESPEWFDVSQKALQETWCMSRSIVMMRLPITHSCSLLNHPNSFRGGMFKLNTKCDADSLLYLLTHFWMQRPHSTHAPSFIYIRETQKPNRIKCYL